MVGRRSRSRCTLAAKSSVSVLSSLRFDLRRARARRCRACRPRCSARRGHSAPTSADVVDADGNSVPISQVMLHHIVFAKIGTPDNTCSQFRGYDGRSFPVPVQRFYGEGEERTAIQFPVGTGYPNRGSDRWGMVFMLMNHRQASQTVWVQYTVQYVTDE